MWDRNTIEDFEWDKESIEDFVSEYEESSFNPGMKQGVKGDVSVDKIKAKCGIHEVELMVDEQVNEFYCPVCE